MSRIFITGVAGFIGSHTADLLLAAGHEVWGIDNFRTGHAANLAGARRHAGFHFTEGDCTEVALTTELVGSCRPAALIHLAALVSVPESIANPAENHRLNFLGTQVAATAARKHGVGRFVFASSAAVYGDNPELPLVESAACRPLSPYGEAKLASEALLLGLAGPEFTVRCQRYFNVYGPRQDPRSPYSGVISRFAAALTQGQGPTIHGDGEQTRDFIAVADVARANLLAATAPGIPSGVANICTGQAVSLNVLGQTMGRLWKETHLASHGPARGGDIRHSLGSPLQAERELGFTRSVSLDEGLVSLRDA